MKSSKHVVALVINVLAAIYIFAYYLQIKDIPMKEVFVVYLLMSVFGVLTVVQVVRHIKALRRERESSDKNVKRIDPVALIRSKPVLLMIMVAVYIAVFPIIGFFVTTYFFLLISNIVLGTRSKKVLAALPLGVVCFVYVIFTLFFRIKIPSGLLF